MRQRGRALGRHRTNHSVTPSNVKRAGACVPHAHGAASGSPGIGTCGEASSACQSGWRRQTGLHAWRSAPAFSRRMRDTAAFRRVMNRMADGSAFKRVSRREMDFQHALRSDGCDEEEQQAEDHEPDNEGDEDRHQNRQNTLRLRLAVIATGLQFAPQFAQV